MYYNTKLAEHTSAYQDKVTMLDYSRVLFGGDTWTIYADDKKVGTVQGLAFHVSGDVYALSSPDGNLVGAETENPQMFSNKATIYDWDSKEIGHLQTEFGSLMTKIDIYRGSNQVGKSEQQFGLSLNTDIKNADGLGIMAHGQGNVLIRSRPHHHPQEYRRQR